MTVVPSCWVVNDERVGKQGVITVASTSGLRRGDMLGIGLNGEGEYEYAVVKRIDGWEVTIGRLRWYHRARWRVQRIARSVWTWLRLGAEMAADAARRLTQVR
jgi:hypothetical protein